MWLFPLQHIAPEAPRGPSPSPEWGSPQRGSLKAPRPGRGLCFSAYCPLAGRSWPHLQRGRPGDLLAVCAEGKEGGPRAYAVASTGAHSPWPVLIGRGAPAGLALVTSPPCGRRGFGDAARGTLSSGPTACSGAGSLGGRLYKHRFLWTGNTPTHQPMVSVGEQTEAQRLSLSLPGPQG